MSLMKTLAKVAIGVAVAKGANHMMKGGAQQQTQQSGGLGGLLGSLTGGAGAASTGAAGGGLQDMLGGLLGGAQGGAAGGMPGGLGGLLESLGGAGGTGGASGGGLQDMLGGLAGAAGAGGLLGGLTSALGQRAQTPNAGFGAVLNSQFAQTPEPEIEPSADQEAMAALMLRAMIQAAKSDGKLDDAEQEKLIGQLGGDVDSQEAAFVQSEMQSDIDVDALAGQVPAGMGPQVYAMSLLAIDLDSQAEAKYLHSFATALGLEVATVNDIHAQMGVPSLYA